MNYQLTPKYDSRASFYGKANVEVDDDEIRLISYTTHVATIKDGKATIKGTYSTTTLRHIKDFLKQHGFKADTKAQIEADYEL